MKRISKINKLNVEFNNFSMNLATVMFKISHESGPELPRYLRPKLCGLT